MKDLLNLKNKVAIVTGASSGIGYATAIRLAEAGCNVVLAARRIEKLNKLESKIKRMGVKVLTVQTDVTQKKDIENLVNMTVKKFGRIDILVNNAGVLDSQEFLSLEKDRLEKVIDTNLYSQVWLGQAVVKQMKKKKSGRIVNITSIAGFKSSSGLTAYNLSKAAIVMLTKNMALELGAFGIRVNGVAPGLIETEMTSGMIKDKKLLKSYLEKIPLNRTGNGTEMANVVLFLASDLSNYVTGETIIADGGWTIHL
uniref:SDR family oxidoreductase n=1 Tax=candidate division CPR3 bacterium TaxID=2268181 RepID=A0A7C4LZZ6_UNCC3